jgi:oligogalacturonide lyase
MGTLERCSTRRSFLLGSAGACSVRGQATKAAVFESDFRRYADPTTEFEVIRLTNPAHASLLPAYYAHSMGRHSPFLVFSCDRTGSRQVFRLDLKTGQSRQLTTVEALDPESVALTPDERSICYFDGPALRLTNLTSLRSREVYRVPAGWNRTAGCCLSSDGLRVAFAESKDGTASRLRQVSVATGSAQTVTEGPWAITHAIPHPRRAQILYRQGSEALWLVNGDGRQNRKLKLGEGRVGPARWSPDGRTVIYLQLPDDPKQLNSIREHAPDAGQDKLVAKTSQFSHFGFNANSSVFVGASRNKASPTILLLLRLTRRELTVCEHRASDPNLVAPNFSPDSQRIYFQSDRDGKPAIYMVRVDRFVEKTELET